MFRITLFILLVACGAARSEAAAWPGAGEDPHPCLYVTAQDVAKVRAFIQAVREEDSCLVSLPTSR